MRRLRPPTALAALLVLLATAAGARAADYGIAITQQLFDGAGNPWLVANTLPDGSLATPSWSICPPGKTYPDCAAAGVADRSFAPGPTAAGTSFFADATIGGGAYGAQSDPWLGRVAATAPPTLTGAAKVGARLTPTAGAWAGGWGDEHDRLQIQACRTADARGCVVIADPRASQTPGGSVVLDPRWSGRYPFAFDERLAADTAEPAIGYLSPASLPPLQAGQTVSRSAPLGRVTGPRLALREHPLLQRDERLLVGRATCAKRCSVAVGVTTGSVRRRATIAVRGTRRLAVPAGGLQLEHGATIRVRIGATPLVTQTVPPGGAVAAGRR